MVELQQNGLPSESNPYIFNGNMVNRGENSIMVLLLLMSSYLISPQSIFFNRGNYEDFDMSYRFVYYITQYIVNIRYSYSIDIYIGWYS